MQNSGVESWPPHAHHAGAMAFAPEPITYHPFNAETDCRALDRAVTPTEAFFVRSNFDVPALDDAHVISVGGEVKTPFQLTARDLKALPHRTLTVTVECAGNDRCALRPLPVGEPWNTGAVATAQWSGVPLKALLDRAMLNGVTQELLFEAADGDDKSGFARSLPVDKALHPDTLLATAMNGAPLTQAHGAPVRLVVPGWYGMASVKWVRQITALSAPFAGHFQTDKYVYDPGTGTPPVPVREMRVKSFIALPPDGMPITAGKVTLRGFAWSGAAKIARVEVAISGGADWTPAVLGEELGPWAWRPFSVDVTLPKGRTALRCRATDDAQHSQPDTADWNRLGYGNNAVRTVLITAT